MCELEQMMRDINSMLKSNKVITNEDLERAAMVRPNEVILLPPPKMFNTAQPSA